jgi:hypothetical protein
MGFRASLDRCGESRLTPGFDPLTAQLVASRYADYIIPAHIQLQVPVLNGTCPERKNIPSPAVPLQAGLCDDKQRSGC